MRSRLGTRKLFLVVTALLAVGLGSSRRGLADTEEGARKHVAKANHLAAKNKCKAALPEFNRAYKTLKDPTLLFNRAECFRKLGRDGEALQDYQQFLAEQPQAPNRAAVEARIASLRETTAGGGAPAGTPEQPPAALVAAPVAPAMKPAEKPATPPAATTSPTVKVVAPVPAEKLAEKPAEAAAPAAKAAEGAAPAAKPASPPPPPARRAEKWAD